MKTWLHCPNIYPLRQKFAFISTTKFQNLITLDAFDRNCERATVLSLLRHLQNQSDLNQRLIIGTTPEALCASCPILEESHRSEIVVHRGTELNFSKFVSDLAETFNYSSEILCEEPGQFATRGGLIDVYPVNGSNPYRIDFFGDEVELIKIFDPTTQGSCGEVDEIIIWSCKNDEKVLRKVPFSSTYPLQCFGFLKNLNYWSINTH